MRARLLVITAAIVGLAACSVVEDGKVERIQPPYGLEDTSPSTTTTIATTTTEAATTTSGLETTTTTVPPIQTEDVQLYFIVSGRLTPVTKALPSPVAPLQLMAALQEGEPEGDAGKGLRTALPAFPEILVETDTTGLALIQLPDDFFTPIPVGDQRLAVGQIVVTVLTNIRGVGQVTFNQAVTTASGELVAAGDPLTLADFELLMSTRGVATPTQSVTTTATTAASTTSIPGEP